MEAIHLRIEEHEDSLNPNDLAEFLYLFRGATVALSRVVPNPEQREVQTLIEYVPTEEIRKIANFSPSQLDSVFEHEAGKGLLQIGSIARQSPIEIVLYGLPTLLVLAVIFSGGKINLLKGYLEAELPPIGKGITKLRKALGLGGPISVGFGIREVTIKLNGEEYRELMVQIRGQGGFQDFFRGLQSRTNKSTKRLTLSTSDLDRIIKHKAHPEKGGYQSRLKKIFERHFPR